jgi:hypothetical protein
VKRPYGRTHAVAAPIILNDARLLRERGAMAELGPGSVSVMLRSAMSN